MRIATLTLCLVLSTAAYPATFLKIDGIQGDSRDLKHPNEIEVASFQLSGKNLVFTKRIDVASAALFNNTASGKRIAKAVLTHGPDTDRRRYTLEDILIGGLKQKAGSPTSEEVTLVFTKLTTETIDQSGSKDSSRSSVASKDPAPPTVSMPSTGTGQSVAIFMKTQSIGSLSMVTKSLGWGIRNTGRAQFDPFDVQKPLDEGSDRLLQYSQTGQHIPEVRLSLQQQGTDFYIYTLKDVVVSGYSRTGSGETFKLQPAAIQVEFKGPQAAGKPEGAVKAGWDLKANKKV